MYTIAGLSILGLLCWVVMFLAGTDVWHFMGSPDFWELDGPPYSDLRALTFALYAQFVVLAAAATLAVRSSLRARRDRDGTVAGAVPGP